MSKLAAVGYEDDSLRERAEDLAQQLNVPVDNQGFPRLSFTQDKLVLLLEHFSPLFVDFNNTQKRKAAGKKQGLIRACKPEKGLKILDLTAGWGRDAALLASFGAEVLMLERQPMMAALLLDGLCRLGSSSMALSLLAIEAKAYLKALAPANFPDVIYIDPMHPVRQKSALVKKDMQALQQLIGADMDALELLQLALTKTRQRVVVKWPQRLPSLIPPQFSIKGETVRFDVYLAF